MKRTCSTIPGDIGARLEAFGLDESLSIPHGLPPLSLTGPLANPHPDTKVSIIWLMRGEVTCEWVTYEVGVVTGEVLLYQGTILHLCKDQLAAVIRTPGHQGRKVNMPPVELQLAPGHPWLLVGRHAGLLVHEVWTRVATCRAAFPARGRRESRMSPSSVPSSSAPSSRVTVSMSG